MICTSPCVILYFSSPSSSFAWRQIVCNLTRAGLFLFRFCCGDCEQSSVPLSFLAPSAEMMTVQQSHQTQRRTAANKLLSQLLLTHLQPALDANQSADQAGFRPGYSATDHLFTFHQFRERAAEWHQPLWVAAIDITLSTLLNTAMNGRPWGNTVSRNHTYSNSQRSTTNNEQRCTPTRKGNNSTSSKEPSRETHSARPSTS